MSRLPRIPEGAELVALSAKQDMAQASIGSVVIALIRRGAPLSFEAIAELLEERAAKDDFLAKGALQFMMSLPRPPE